MCKQHLLILPCTSASLTPNAAYLHIHCTQSFFRAELFFRTFKQLFLFKINHIKSALQNSSAPRQLLQGLLHINCFKSTKDPVLVPLNDLHECTWKPNSSKFSRGKNPCQTTLRPNDREDAAGRLAAQAGTQTGKCFWLKISRLSPTASCNLRLWQPSLKLLNVLQCPNTDRDAGFLLYHFFLWTYHSSFNTANTILKDGQRTCPPNCTSCLLFIAPPKDNDSWQIIVIIPDH